MSQYDANGNSVSKLLLFYNSPIQAVWDNLKGIPMIVVNQKEYDLFLVAWDCSVKLHKGDTVFKRKGGKLRISRLESDYEIPGTYRTMIFKFSKSALYTHGINLMTFYLNGQNKCFKYIVSYVDGIYKNKVKDQFDHSPGFKKIRDSLKWINPVQKYVATVLPTTDASGAPSPLFLLEVKISRQ